VVAAGPDAGPVAEPAGLAEGGAALSAECAKATRRRGAELELAIREATLSVLASVGSDRLTMDLVAEQAQTSKRVLYRRWPTKMDLIVDALESSLAERPVARPDTGDLRADLVAVLLDAAALLRSREGNVMARLALEVGACPQLSRAGENRLWGRRKAIVREIINRAVERGQARPDALTDEASAIGISLLFLRGIGEGRRVTRRDVEAIVDNAWVPALRA